MKYVIDASVAFKWVVPEQDSDKALRLRDDYRNAAIELLAFPLELAHALTRASRQGRVAAADIPQHLADILATLPALHPSLSLLLRASAIALQARIGIYDCIYVALAEQEGCTFVTADDRLVKILQSQFPFVVALSIMP